MTIKAIVHKISGFDTVEIYGISDLHIGSREFNQKLFEETVQDILSEPNRYCVIIGDILDNGLKTSKTDCYLATMQPAEQRALAVKLLKPLENRILCWTGGNHEQRTSKDADVDISATLADKVGVLSLYRPGLAVIQLHLGKRASGHKIAPKYSIGVTHGTGGGLMLGSGLSKTEPYALAMGFDVMITGHSHKPATAPSMRFEHDFTNKCMRSREMRVMVATGWLDYGGYPISKMYRPVMIKPNKVILNGLEYGISVLS